MRERGHVRRWAAAGVATVALAGGAATYTPLFAADDIRIQGGAVPDAEVLAIAGLDARTNVFHLDERLIEGRLRDDPRILDATVRTSLPDTIRISIVPRTAVAIADRSLVGQDGVVIGPSIAEGGSLPRIHGDVPTGAATASAMSPGLRRSVEAIVVAADGEIRVRLEEGPTAVLGDGTQLEAKAASLAALLRWAAGAGVAIAAADVSVPGSPSVELERGKAAEPRST